MMPQFTGHVWKWNYYLQPFESWIFFFMIATCSTGKEIDNINLLVYLGFFDIVIKRWALKYIYFFIRLQFSNGSNFHMFFKAS